MCHDIHMEARGQLSEAGSLFPPWNLRVKLVIKLAQQAHLPAERSLAQGKSIKYENTIARDIIALYL